jgi:hypothetical protein
VKGIESVLAVRCAAQKTVREDAHLLDEKERRIVLTSAMRAGEERRGSVVR